MAESQGTMDESRLIAEAMGELRAFLDERHWDYCLVGGLAATRWGEPRFTKDIDIVLLTGFGNESQFVQPLLEAFPARLADAALFAREHRILLLSSKNGVALDISLGGLPFEEEMLSRSRSTLVLPGVEMRTASPEDIVIMKSIANRPIDLKDIEGILSSQGDKLDCDYIRRWLSELAELWYETDLVGNFEQMLRSVAHRMKSAPALKSASERLGEE